MTSPLSRFKLIGARRENRRAGRAACAMAVLALAAACSSSSTSSPTAPTAPAAPATPAPSVSAVLVTESSATSTAHQLMATARFSDATTKDVTLTAVWESLNPSLATVAANGLVTIVAPGEVEVRATYQSVSGALKLVTTPARTVVLTGVVREVQPNEHPLAGVRVEVIEGPNAGKFALSDSSGAFQLSGLSMGPVVLSATLTGYEDWRLDDLTLTSDSQQDPWMVVVPPVDATGSTATARCRDGSWSWAPDRAAACEANGGIAYVVCPGPFCRPDLLAPSH